MICSHFRVWVNSREKWYVVQPLSLSSHNALVPVLPRCTCLCPPTMHLSLFSHNVFECQLPKQWEGTGWVNLCRSFSFRRGESWLTSLSPKLQSNQDWLTWRVVKMSAPAHTGVTSVTGHFQNLRPLSQSPVEIMWRIHVFQQLEPGFCYFNWNLP